MSWNDFFQMIIAACEIILVYFTYRNNHHKK